MKITAVKIDQYGQIRGSGIHDAVVQAFRFVMDDHFDICLRDSSGQERWLLLRGVTKIGFKDLVNGTIVSEVFCWKLETTTTGGNVLPTEAWRVLFGENYIEKDFEGLVATTQEQHAMQLLVLLESSYGGSIAAICHEVLFAAQ
jgi:hypothetical protein